MSILKEIILKIKRLGWRIKTQILRMTWATIWIGLKYNSSIIDQSSLSNLTIGNNTWIWRWVVINALNWIEVWDNVLISDYCAIVSTDHESKDINIPISEQWYTTWEEQKIIIWDWVWIWFNVIIMKWVTIWSNSIIWAWSVVTKDVESNSIYAWVPAKFIKKR